MAFIPALLIFLFVVGLIILIVQIDASGFKIMLMGINITLFGGILAIGPNSIFGGFGYLIAILGLIISAIGLWKKG